MCQIQNVSQMVIDAIKAEVTKLVNERKMFSIWDAITCARKTTKAFLGQYKDIKQVVPELYNDGEMPGYDVATVSFSDRKGGMVQGRVYYPDDGIVDPYTQYNSKAIHGDSSQSSTSQSSQSSVAVSSVSPTDDEEVEIDLVSGVTKAYRLNISPTLMYEVDFLPGQKVYMTYGSDNITISSYAPGHILQVNKDYRLRISGKWLERIVNNGPIDSSTKFKIMVVHDKTKDRRFIKIVTA